MIRAMFGPFSIFWESFENFEGHIILPSVNHNPIPSFTKAELVPISSNRSGKENGCLVFLCPQRNFGGHIVIALSVRPAFVSGPYLLYSLR